MKSIGEWGNEHKGELDKLAVPLGPFLNEPAKCKGQKGEFGETVHTKPEDVCFTLYQVQPNADQRKHN